MIDIFAELDKKFNIVNKTRNLSRYLTSEYVFNVNGSLESFYQLFQNSFHNWHLNDNYSDLDSMLVDSGIGYKHYDFVYGEDVVDLQTDNEEQCYIFLQFHMNALEFLKEEYKRFWLSKEFASVENKILSIVNKVNLSFIYDNQKKYYKLCENKQLVREIAQNTDEHIARLLYEYNSVDIKNNIDEKKSILVNLATYTEPITKAYTKNSGDIYELFDNLDFALNNFHIRHNNLEGKKKKDYLLTLNEKQRIELYDATYDLILATLSQSQNQASLDKIKGLKSNF